MAFASFPARQGQQRSLLRIFNVLSWAFCSFSGSAEPRVGAVSVFLGFRLVFPIYGIFAQLAPWYPLSARVTKADFLELLKHAPDPLGPLVVHRSRQCPGDPQDVSGGTSDDLQVIPCFLCLPE